MINKEEYKRELIRMWDMKRGNDYKGKDICDGVFCEDCPLSEINNDEMDGCMEPMKVFEIIKIVEKWAKENPPKKFKVSRLEYDILDMFIKNNSEIDYVFNNFGDAYIPKLLEKGYFKGANGNMSIRYYYNNCEVEDNDDN